MLRIATVFFTSHADTVGNAYRINRLISLSKKYKLIIITNQPKLLSNILPNVKLIVVKQISILNLLHLNDLFFIKNKLKKLKYDLLYYFHNDALIALVDNHPKMCEIHQSHEIIGIYKTRSKGLKGKIKNWFDKFNAFLLIAGIKKADYCFAVSEQLKDFFIEKGIKSQKIEYLPHGVNTTLFNFNKVKPSSLLDFSRKTTLLWFIPDGLAKSGV